MDDLQALPHGNWRVSNAGSYDAGGRELKPAKLVMTSGAHAMRGLRKPPLGLPEGRATGIRAAEMSGMSISRILAFCSIYAITLLSQPEFYMVLLTAPMFAAILISINYTNRTRIDYIDAVALIYFISFVIVPMQSASNFAFPDSMTNRGIYFSQDWFEIIAALALFSYIALVAFLIPRKKLYPAMVRQTRQVSGAIFVVIAAALAILAIPTAGSLENLYASRYDRELSGAVIFLPIIIAGLSVNAMFALIRPEPNWLVKYAVAGFACAALLFVANPLNTARFVLLGAWIPIFLIVVPALLRPSFFYLAVPSVILVVMPVLSITTRFSENRSDLVAAIFSDWTSLFKIAFFDLFESACDAMRHVEQFGHQGGNLFVSTVLSFVPRAWWPDKPINSGLLVGWMHVDEGGGNENLAVSWFMDGYMDFGIIGSLVYAVMFAAVFGAVRMRSRLTNNYDLAFFIFVANCAILIRGTLAVVYMMVLFQLIFLWLYNRFFTVRAAEEPRPPRAAYAQAASRMVQKA